MGYEDAPWHFRGRALYQLSLVKVEEAKKYVPPELPLVNFFGWTLGGFYLARYSHSPVGAFDELVAMAGLAWNFPSSCAWAARVYVNNREARDHGIQEVGLPSRLASFRALPPPQLPAAGRVSAAPAGQLPAGSGPGPGPASASASGGDGGGRRRGGGGGSRGGAAAATVPGEAAGDTLLERALSRMGGSGGSWWDGSWPQQHGRSRGGGGGGGGGGGQGSGAEREPSPPGTWAVELSNEEPRGALALLPSLLRGRGRERRGGPCRGLAGGPVCRIELPPQPPGRGPRITMCLPSFSGATPDFPGFLQYDLRLHANIRPVPTARLAFPTARSEEERSSPEVLDLVLGGRPLICLEFGDMEMEVQAPVPWRPRAL